jgi:hypothetical protein
MQMQNKSQKRGEKLGERREKNHFLTGEIPSWSSMLPLASCQQA